MAKEICISSTPHETRLAILEDDQLAEIYYERENEYTLAGSIYNGRVTRVLPGMQSAFVDLGLERDAFLYVTDFIELEDQEETDELERAAASGAGQAPREVKHPHGIDSNGAGAPDDSQRASNSSAGWKGGRQEERGPRRDQNRQESRPEPRQAEEARTPSIESPHSGTSAIQDQSGLAQDSDEAGARRWRGRRRRRGGRGPSDQPASRNEFEPVSVSRSESQFATEQSPTIQASEAAPAPHEHRAPAPFVLPGESLSKYGGTPGAESAKSAPEPAGAAPPCEHIQALHAYRSTALLGRQRTVTGGVALTAPRWGRTSQLKRHKRRKTIWPRSPRKNLYRKRFSKRQKPLWRSFMKVN